LFIIKVNHSLVLDHRHHIRTVFLISQRFKFFLHLIHFNREDNCHFFTDLSLLLLRDAVTQLLENRVSIIILNIHL
jgi:hypothetical protein